MDTVAVTVIVLYLVGVTAVGALMARRSRGSSDWAVAGGGMSGILVAFALAGARIGGAGTYGVAGDVVTGGVWNMWWYGISSFAALVLVGLRLRGLLPATWAPNRGGAVLDSLRLEAVPVAHQPVRADRVRHHQRHRGVRDRRDHQLPHSPLHAARHAHRRPGTGDLRVSGRSVGHGGHQRHPLHRDPGLPPGRGGLGRARVWRLGRRDRAGERTAHFVVQRPRGLVGVRGRGVG